MPTESALLCSISRFIINVDDCNISSSIITNLTAFSGLQFYKKIEDHSLTDKSPTIYYACKQQSFNSTTAKYRCYYSQWRIFMSVESMIMEGLYLMLIGMGFVISFLTILVFILSLMERFIDHEQVEVMATTDKQMSNSTLTAVISAAIHQHRHKHK